MPSAPAAIPSAPVAAAAHPAAAPREGGDAAAFGHEFDSARDGTTETTADPAADPVAAAVAGDAAPTETATKPERDDADAGQGLAAALLGLIDRAGGTAVGGDADAGVDAGVAGTRLRAAVEPQRPLLATWPDTGTAVAATGMTMQDTSTAPGAAPAGTTASTTTPVGDPATGTAWLAAATANPVAAGVLAVLGAGGRSGAMPAEPDAGALAVLGAATHAAAASMASAPAPGAHVLAQPAPVGSPQFAQEFGQQIAWLSQQDIKQARIRLNPQELGALDVQLSVQHGRVDIVLHAQHPGAVQAVQQSLPQLDQMLAQHGLALGEANVGQHGHGAAPGGGGGERAAAGEGLDAAGGGDGLSTVAVASGSSLLDAFA